MNKSVVCENVKRSFGEEKPLRGVSFHLPKKGFFGILGSSGSGKSTLLNILGMLDVGYEGDVLILGKNPKRMSEAERCAFRLKEIGYVFQSFNLLELETVEFNLSLPLQSCYRVKKRRRLAKLRDALSLVGLDGYQKRIVNSLSGGEKQRVAIARAVINNPSLLLLDEPSAALDQENSARLFSILKKLSSRCLVLVVSHDVDLLSAYSDAILELDQGQIAAFSSKEGENSKECLPIRIPGKERAWPRLPFFSLLFHAWHILKRKKWRSLFTEGAIAAGLLGIGMSLYLSFSISDQIESSFASIVPENRIVMKEKAESVSPYSNVYSCSPESAEALVESFPDELLDYGSSFLMNFEEWFSDDNLVYALRGAEQISLLGFSARSFNDYQWLDLVDDGSFYPKRPSSMEFDEIVLGLPYPDMFQLCFRLQIERSFESLGDYLSDVPLPIVLRVSRLDYGFQDEQIFNLVSVYPSQKRTIAHLDHRWARSLFVDRMRFKPWNGADTPSPQAIYEVPYVEPRGDPSFFLSKARAKEKYKGIVFQKASSLFLGSLLEKGEATALRRLYLFSCDLLGPSWREIEEVSSFSPFLLGRDVLTPGGYFADTQSLIAGFLKHLVFTPSEEEAKTVVDSYSRLPLDQKDVPIELPGSCKDAGALQTSLPLRTIYGERDFNVGKAPLNYEEIGVSSALYRLWGQPDEIYVAAELEGEEAGDFYNRSFSLSKVKVTGVKESESEAIYLCSDWSADFLFLSAGADPFSLLPNGAIFQVDDAADLPTLLDELREAFPRFRFGSPSLEVSSAIESSLGYIKKVLVFFAAFAFLLSFLLSAIVLGIALKENGKEARLLYAMGADRKQLSKAFLCHILLSLGAALVSSCVSLLALEAAVGLYLAHSFGTPIRFRFSLLPLGGCLGCAGVFLLCFYVLISFRLRRSEIW